MALTVFRPIPETSASWRTEAPPRWATRIMSSRTRDSLAALAAPRPTTANAAPSSSANRPSASFWSPTAAASGTLGLITVRQYSPSGNTRDEPASYRPGQMPSLFGWLRPAPLSDDYLTWTRTEVNGRTVEYGVAGPDGPPVVFLHGFALGSHAYKRPLRRLARRGCRVFAPAMPGFGATPPLEPGEETLTGYADWVVAFMKTLDIKDRAFLIGHSFGGAVATRAAHSYPDRVSHVVLLNAVGGVSPRPLTDWLTGFAKEFSAVRSTVEMAIAARDDVVTNLWRNPLALLRIASVARYADVREQLSDLRTMGIPVLVLTSDGDSVIPLRCFEAVCEILGTPGHVVSGNHSWLLTDPDSFGEVLGSLVDVEVARHQSRRAISRAGEVTALLAQTRVPGSTITKLLAKAPALWLTSESAAVLAADLALCHPKLGDDEIRAVVRPMDDTTMRLTVVARDRPGLLADSAAVLAGNGLSISEASANTWPDMGLALHSFVLSASNTLEEPEWKVLCDGLRALSSGRRPTSDGPRRGTRNRRVIVDCYGVGQTMSVVKVNADDEVGLLASITEWFAGHGVSIQALQARSAGGRADDTFLVTGVADASSLKRYLETASTNALVPDRRRTSMPSAVEPLPGGRSQAGN